MKLRRLTDLLPRTRSRHGSEIEAELGDRPPGWREGESAGIGSEIRGWYRRGPAVRGLPESDTPTGQVADVEVTAPYEDLDAVRRFAREVAVVTFEFENVPAPTAAAEHAPVRPGGEVLHVTQHRLREKDFLAQHGFPVTPYRPVRISDQLSSAVENWDCRAF